MSKIALTPNASGTGVVTIASPNTNTDRTITLPDDNGTFIYANASGNVGIGTTSPSQRLHVAGAVFASGDGSDVAFYMDGSDAIRNTSTGGIVYHDVAFGGAAHGQFVFRSSNAATERARIDSSGNLLVGKTSTLNSVAGIRLYGDSVGAADFTRDGGRTAQFNRLSSDGAVVEFARQSTPVGTISVTGSATAYNTSSDYRLKENVQPMQNALDTVAQLNPVTYTWKADGSAGQGFIAHELQAVVPDCVTGEKDAVDAEGNPQYQGIDTSFLVATLVKAIQEQQAMIQALQAEVAALKGVSA